jgi:nicotinamide-nucleotide amidase
MPQRRSGRATTGGRPAAGEAVGDLPGTMPASIRPGDETPDPESLALLASQVLEASRLQGMRLATAESCTGGLIGALLTDVPGASASYVGGIISYTDAVKMTTLGVPAEVLAHHGAVSAQVAVAMAEGARRAIGADLAIAVTGIAGPSGGTAQKPVGLTYVAVADQTGQTVERHLWRGDRPANRRASAAAALRLALERLRGPAR